MPELASAGDGFGAVGRAELTEHVGDIALGEGEPGPLGGDRVEQTGGGRAGASPFGLIHGQPGPGGVSFRLPDPGQGGQAGGQRLGVAELPTQQVLLGQAWDLASSPDCFRLSTCSASTPAPPPSAPDSSCCSNR
jgi:hypothetical protein